MGMLRVVESIFYAEYFDESILQVTDISLLRVIDIEMVHTIVSDAIKEILRRPIVGEQTVHVKLTVFVLRTSQEWDLDSTSSFIGDVFQKYEQKLATLILKCVHCIMCEAMRRNHSRLVHGA